MKGFVVLALIATASLVHADSPPGGRMDRIRALYAERDFEGVRRELLAAYAEDPKPELLFALGQVELNLGNYQAAIDYYERFIATSPAEDQVALAQQAIGAARIRLAEPPREPPQATVLASPPAPVDTRPEPAPKRWTLTHSGLVAFGGAAFVLGAGLLYYSHRLGTDRSGTLSDYDARLDQARTTRWTGGAIATAGTLLVGVTLLW